LTRDASLRAAAIAFAYGAALLIVAAASTPRRVGDGAEYVVMALRFASLHGPALSRSEIVDAQQQLATLGPGFGASLLEYPDLVAADGRQDFLHFWLYPLLVAPFVPVSSALGLHPNWAFTACNAVLLAAAVFVIARRQPLVTVAAGFVGPIIWWVDKAHTEAFLFAAVSVAAVLALVRPAAAVLLYGAAGAQNAALGVTWPFFVAAAWLGTRRSAPWRVQEWIATLAGSAVVALPFVYTWGRLGRLSPMAEYAQFAVPHWNGVTAFLIEPNIGLGPNAPAFVVALAAPLVLLWRRAPLPAVWWWPALIQLMLLALWSQNPNANHGGTPGVNRWTLSLLALSLPWLGALAGALAGTGRVALIAVVAVAAAASGARHLPQYAERYVSPSALAAWMWSRGFVRPTPGEVFAERVQGREAPRVPASYDGCRVVLMADGQWPMQCVPPAASVPPACTRVGSLCYGIARGNDARVFTTANNGFFYSPAVPSWPASGPLAAGVRDTLLLADDSGLEWQPQVRDRWVDIAQDVAIEAILHRERALVVYISRTGAQPRLRLRTATFSHAAIRTLIPAAKVAEIAADDGSVDLRLPAQTSNLAIALR
jgi:hypothetical protein